MTPNEIQRLLSLGEGQRVEFKLHYRNVAPIGQAVCGFLNSAGGYVVCGVADRGQVVGVDASDEAVKTFEKQLHDGLSPKALVSVHVQELEGKPLLIIEVPAGKDVPFAFRDAIFIRSGESTRKADVETIRDLVLRKQIEPERWERRFSFADLEKDIDAEEIRSAVTAAQKVRRAFFRDANDPVKILEDLSVAKYGRLTNGGDVLFGRNPAERLPQVRVRAACYPSGKAGDTFRDMKSFEGPLFQVLEQTFDFIVRNTPTISSFSPEQLQRRDRTLYPEDAVREGLVNAFAHRDYASSSGGVTVGIYPNRLEIWNSGSLPEGITPEKLIAGHLSILRNPDIAHVLYLRGLMEKLGRGSVLILQECERHGLPAPTWTSDEKTGVTLTFPAPEVTPEVTGEVTGEVKRLLAVVNGEMKRQEIQAQLGLKHEEHFRDAYLKPALQAGVIEMTQPDKPKSSKQRYRLTALGKAVCAKIAK